MIFLGGGTKIRKDSKIPIPVTLVLHELGHDIRDVRRWRVTTTFS